MRRFLSLLGETALETLGLILVLVIQSTILFAPVYLMARQPTWAPIEIVIAACGLWILIAIIIINAIGKWLKEEGT